MRLLRASVFIMLCCWYIVSFTQEDIPNNMTIHVVQRGENLFRIALSYGLKTDELAQANGIRNAANIQVGQRLLVPLEVDMAVHIDEPVHIVQPGETLDNIAALYGIRSEDLLSYNSIDNGNNIFVGQPLQLSAAASTTVISQEGESSTEDSPSDINLPEEAVPFLHVVQSGESLFRIATLYGLTVNDLVSANGISDPTIVYAGQQLIIPGLKPPQLLSELPHPVVALTVNPLILAEGQTGVLNISTGEPSIITGTFLGKAFTAQQVDNRTDYLILLPIPIFSEAGIYPLELQIQYGAGEETRISANVQVIAWSYGSEYINLLAGRDDLLNANVEEAEMLLLQNVTRSVTPDRYFSGLMSLPAAAAMTSQFGTRRSYNGSAFDRYHSGVDFAGVPGTPILAAAAGQVVMADTLNVRGKATIIDHGWGVYTGYWHQSEMMVAPGDFVEAGQIIGTIGSTGRVTGAHLHWEVWVNGVQVEPMQWVRQSFF